MTLIYQGITLIVVLLIVWQMLRERRLKEQIEAALARINRQLVSGGEGEVGFAGDFPGRIQAFDLKEGQSVLCQRDGFIMLPMLNAWASLSTTAFAPRSSTTDRIESAVLRITVPSPLAIMKSMYRNRLLLPNPRDSVPRLPQGPAYRRLR